ncbi:MAG: hypothetical protein JWM07_540 [Candidatus Saccharibacteria bacterium]|nr:hypothetical protein [Candidatus Saccharibacteria bacterium]
MRRTAIRKIAKDLNVDDVFIFVRDEDLGILLPAPGFQQTFANGAEWAEFLQTSQKSGRYVTTLPYPDSNTLQTFTALSYKNKLTVIMAGDMPNEQNVLILQKLLPILSSLLHYEQYVEQSNVYTQQAELSAEEHKNIAKKLDATRRNLQLVLNEKENEISERVKSESALATSEHRFRFMAESLAAMIFTSEANGDIDYISPRWQYYTGVSLDILRTKGLRSVLHPDDKNNVVQHWHSSYELGVPIEQEVRIKRADGTYRWHLSRAEAMRNDTGEIIMWVGSSTDIEDVKSNMEKKLELEERTELLTRQQKDLLELSAAKDEFIRLASHQLRTPATGVKMYIGMLMEGYADPPTKSQLIMLHQAYKSNDRQLHIIDDLLKVATIDAGKVILNKETCDLEELVSEVVQELAHSTTKHQQQVTIISPQKNITADVDKRYMRMVIENIIDNASKYSPDDTTITVSITENVFKEITITDQGVGITKNDQVLLFKKFSRVHNAMSVSAAGTGLGLYWAKEIITLHGGSIALTSKLRHGSTFIIKLP